MWYTFQMAATQGEKPMENYAANPAFLQSTPGGVGAEQEVADWRRLANQAHEQLRLAFDLVRLGGWDWNIEHKQITRIGYHEQLFGLDPGALPSTYEGFLARLHPEDREPVQRAIERCVSSCEDYRQEYRVIWPDGGVHWIEGYGRVQCDETGEPIRMIGVLRDITERKESEKHEARFRAVFEAAQDAILIADDDRRYVVANAAAGTLFGLEPVQLCGRRIDDFIQDVRGAAVGDAWQQFQTAGVQRGECRVQRPDGTLVEAEYSAKTSFAPGLHLSILRDVTERKQAEQVLARQASELRRSNEDLQQFAYVASHDLREPLRSIISFSQLLAKRFSGQFDRQAEEFVEYIISGARRMEELIGSLLMYTSVVNVELSVNSPVPLEVTLHSAKMNLQAVIGETRSAITHDRLPAVKADQVQLIQLFQNLISNAIKYRKPEQPAQVHVSAERSGSDWIISVQDNGIGIQREYAERIFGVFKRLHGKEVPGAGLGLAICKRIVEKHGGRIWVESLAGEGSTFRFSIPH